MRDNLKDLIENSGEDFELYTINAEKEWSNLSKKINVNTVQRTSWQKLGIAACFATIIACTIFFMNNAPSGENEIAELERFYNGEINQKITLIESQLTDDHILQDLDEMDKAFAELKGDLKENVDNQEVITAMMENYRLKLQILEEILSELEKERGEEVL